MTMNNQMLDLDPLRSVGDTARLFAKTPFRPPQRKELTQIWWLAPFSRGLASGLLLAAIWCVSMPTASIADETAEAKQPADPPVGDNMLGSLGQWASDLLGR
jgi:hypothetical protein